MKTHIKILFTAFFVIILLLGFAVPVNMAGNWYQQFMPNLNNEPISDIFFLDSLTGFAVTGDGLPNDSNYILKTINGGDNWIIKYTAYRDFFRIKFINQNTGFACGGFNVTGGGLFKSTNGGENWNQVNSPSNIVFRDMSVLNNDTLWLVDNNSLEGGVFRTTDSGSSWIPQGNFGSSNPSHIYMYNARIGFIDGLKRTTNGGFNWTTIPGEPSLFFDMYFVDSLTGWKCHQQMKKTTDGGLTWINQTLPTGGNIVFNYMLNFSNINKDTIYGAGGVINTPSGLRGIIFRTTDGGNNWLFQVPDTAIHSTDYRNIQFIDKLKGWAYWPSSGVHTTTGGDPIWLTGIKQISSQIPKEFRLYQNYPNPFNPGTIIKYQIVNNKYQKKANVILEVFDVTGKELVTLVNEEQSAGTYEVDFSGTGYSSGVYFYTLIINDKVIDTKKMLLIK